MMKKRIFIIVLFLTVAVFGQKNEFNFIKLDSTWGKEVIRFPARNMNYIGTGEVRFPPKGWIQPTHPNFWSYTYAWSINVNREIKATELATNLEKYFNSLNKISMDDEKNPKKTTASVYKTKKQKETTFYEGKVTIFDRFATNEMLTLNVKIESNYCKKNQKTVILFKFSPKRFSHKTWETLNGIELMKTNCE